SEFRQGRCRRPEVLLRATDRRWPLRRPASRARNPRIAPNGYTFRSGCRSAFCLRSGQWGWRRPQGHRESAWANAARRLPGGRTLWTWLLPDCPLLPIKYGTLSSYTCELSTSSTRRGMAKNCLPKISLLSLTVILAERSPI